MKKVISFTTSPKYDLVGQTSSLKKLIHVIFLTFCSVIAIILFVKLLILLRLDILLPENKLDKHSNLSLILGAIIFAPIFEEIKFRLFLKKNIFYLIIFFAGWFLFLININKLAGIFIGSFIFILIITILLNWQKTDKILTILYKNHFSYIFYLSVISFALVHLSNYDIMPNQLWLIPILIFPQFILGILLGYIRIKYGIIWSILLHTFYNASIFIINKSMNL